MSTGVESLGGESSESDVAAALEGAFGGAEPEKVEPEAAADPVEGEEGPLEGLLAPEAEPEEEAAPPEPEFEIEIDGTPEVIRGADKVKELLTRGLKAGRQHEENARYREALVAQAKQQEIAAGFQQAVIGDLAELRALEANLESWDKVDWASAFDTDPFQAMKWREQRDQLREQRNTKREEINSKHAQFKATYDGVAAERGRAESAALLAKVPEWRNAEKALPEKQAIVRDLAEHYGFTADEIGSLIDHRMLLVARDAAKYRELQRTKTDKVKQVRDTPPVVKPGAVLKQTGKVEFTKVRSHIRALGQKGQSKAQEAAFTELLNRAYK